MTDLTPSITTHHTNIPSPLPSSPSFVFHLTRLRDTLMLWVGTGPPSDGSFAAGLSDTVPSTSIEEKKIAAEWAVGMPGRGSIPVTSTPIYRSGTSDLAVPLSSRLARRFPPNQIHLSLSLPTSLTAQSGPSLDPFANKVLLVMEKKLVAWIEEVLNEEKKAS
ncbi:hypothetical protein BCR39DRAFT_376013 [Naematelia encephala]|uniref:Proteasome assembly chaperone 4 n=1 Tax=Naematelia encephala TaxID=71784 RepID=A0A1Y2BCH9_9TREE|nr:hypothetical protein BCR39DRAFT_376013 [Naematelia encephala]